MALRADGWAGAAVWARGVEQGLTLEAILDRSEVVTMGVDGGGLDDLLGIAVIGREKGTKRWLGWAHAFISDIGIERRKANIEMYEPSPRRRPDQVHLQRRGRCRPRAANIAYVVDLAVASRTRGCSPRSASTPSASAPSSMRWPTSGSRRTPRRSTRSARASP
jgi:hypothetical protein